MAARRNDSRTSDARSAGGDARLESVLAYATRNLGGDLRLRVLAERVGLSPSRFSHWFREQTGMTPHAWIVERRVARAKTLLRTTRSPLIEIALDVGFGSQACLNVAFCRHVGMTPGAYRSRISRKTKDASPVNAQDSDRSKLQ